MSDLDEELGVPDERADFLSRLYKDVQSTKAKRQAAEADLVKPEGRVDSGNALAQVFTSVLPVLLGAAISGRRGGMVGADTGIAAAQNFFNQSEKTRKEKEAEARVRYDKESDAEKTAQARLSSATEGMFRDDMSLKKMAQQNELSDKRLAAAMQTNANNIAAGFEKVRMTQEGANERQRERQGFGQAKNEIPGATIQTDEKTGKPYVVSEKDSERVRGILDGYMGSQTYIDGLRSAIKRGDLQGQVSNFGNLISQLKNLRGYGGALTSSEQILTGAGLPPIADVTTEGLTRWLRGKAKGGNLEGILNEFTRQLNKEVSLRTSVNKYDIPIPPDPGTIITRGGRRFQSLGTVGKNFKPNFIEVTGDNS